MRQLSHLLLVFTAAGSAAAQQPSAQPLGRAQGSSYEPPLAPPASWQKMIGEYGRDSTRIVIVLERYGRLILLREGDESRLVQTGTGAFRLGDAKVFRRGDTTVVFPQSSHTDRITDLIIGRTNFPRRALGPEDGAVMRITPLRPVADLQREALAATPPNEPGEFRPSDLVELVGLDSTIALDIRYAGTRNFLGAPFYSSARAFLQRPAAEALLGAHLTLRAYGLGLLIHDGYRPWYVTRMFWDATTGAQHEFVADPSQGSRHNRGCAVDLTLYNLKTGQPVEMPGTYDEFSRRSYPDYPGGTARQRWYRDLLRRVMEAEGYTVYSSEWWHFDYRDWKQYRIGNATFEQLGR